MNHAAGRSAGASIGLSIVLLWLGFGTLFGQDMPRVSLRIAPHHETWMVLEDISLTVAIVNEGHAALEHVRFPTAFQTSRADLEVNGASLGRLQPYVNNLPPNLRDKDYVTVAPGSTSLMHVTLRDDYKRIVQADELTITLHMTVNRTHQIKSNTIRVTVAKPSNWKNEVVASGPYSFNSTLIFRAGWWERSAADQWLYLLLETEAEFGRIQRNAFRLGRVLENSLWDLKIGRDPATKKIRDVHVLETLRSGAHRHFVLSMDGLRLTGSEFFDDRLKRQLIERDDGTVEMGTINGTEEKGCQEPGK